MLASIAVTLTLILPGSGHLLLRRYLKGTMLAVLFVASVDIFLIAMFLLGQGWEAPLSRISLGLAAAVWVYALISILRALNTLRDKDFQQRKDDLLRRAQVAFLRDELSEAETLLRGILALDERDIEAWVHLGKVQKADGREKEARKSFRSALHLTGSERWRWQLRAELGYADIDANESEAS